MTPRLKDTVALVTGASSGIGEATALGLAGEGATVALLARRRERLDGLAARIADAGGRAIAVEADVADREQAVDAVNSVVAQLGRLDTVVNNAGLMRIEPGTVATEITDHLPKADRDVLDARTEGMVKLEPGDIADAVTFIVTRDRRVAVNELLVRSAEQTW